VNKRGKIVYIKKMIKNKEKLLSIAQKITEKEKDVQRGADILSDATINATSKAIRAFEVLDYFFEEMEQEIGSEELKKRIEAIGNTGKMTVLDGLKLILEKEKRLRIVFTTSRYKKT